ncbi:hypothetical protein glysoja_048068 [Glycine soja]|uniref:Uncharacterized protein n=1 Tax=Glycine soja TaxID=3848 RepID=A0A0B2PWH0_GLYSO|nr:hypothetical protein glysoja_048068 [Glycine soja]
MILSTRVTAGWTWDDHNCYPVPIGITLREMKKLVHPQQRCGHKISKRQA